MNNLDFLLNDTYYQLVDTAQKIAQVKTQLSVSSERLSATVEIIILLCRIRFKLVDEEYAILRMHLSPNVDDDNEHGWEETVNASLTYLLKNCLGKGGKPQNTAHVGGAVKALTDISKLKQHITLVCDRISKGFKLEV